jgi:hypothetical protein
VSVSFYLTSYVHIVQSQHLKFTLYLCTETKDFLMSCLTCEWRILHNKELYNFHSLLYIIRVIKSRRMRVVGHEACMGATGNAYRISVGNSNHFGHTSICGRITLRWVSRRYILGCELDL